MAEVLQDVSSYVDAAIWLAQSPANQEARHSYDHWHDTVARQLVLFPVSVYHPEEGFAGGGELAQRQQDSLERRYEANPEIAEFLRQTSQSAVDKALQSLPTLSEDHIFTPAQQRANVRGDFIYLGSKAPMSGNLEISDFADFYDLLTGSCRRLFTEPKETDFMTRRIRSDMLREAYLIYSGWNVNPIPKNQALQNIEAAHRIIGYRLGLLGRLALGSAKVLDKVAPRDNRWGDLASAG